MTDVRGTIEDVGEMNDFVETISRFSTKTWFSIFSEVESLDSN